ncbi:hypothetical protein, partial [Streptomyces sp. adm13(2018)]|uniref:hypothetical protein n=1 Tax=Streptomyces sp. adm13(2018) TaxID=2479007 RepID=UPI001C9C341B
MPTEAARSWRNGRRAAGGRDGDAAGPDSGVSAGSLLAGALSLAFFALLQPVGGLLSDRFGRK